MLTRLSINRFAVAFLVLIGWHTPSIAAELGKPVVYPTYRWLKSWHSQNTLEKRITPPHGFTRIPSEAGSFAEFLRGLPFKPGQPSVHLYNGQLKGNQRAHLAVIDIDVGKKDLQQCADAIIRLRAEYLFQKGDYGKIHFHYASGFSARYSRWREGYRPVVKGRQVIERHSHERQEDWLSFREYLDSVFQYANTYSLSKEMVAVANINDMQIGDVFIKGGFPGHAVIVADMARDSIGRRVFLLLQSYMPAQEIQLLRKPGSDSPWYPVDFGEALKTPEWQFETKDLRRFN